MTGQEQHAPTAECESLHCYSCHVDEPADGTEYIVCRECGHVYLTAWELRRAYRHMLWQVFRLEGMRNRLWLWLTVRARRLPFCPKCSHDF